MCVAVCVAMGPPWDKKHLFTIHGSTAACYRQMFWDLIKDIEGRIYNCKRFSEPLHKGLVWLRGSSALSFLSTEAFRQFILGSFVYVFIYILICFYFFCSFCLLNPIIGGFCSLWNMTLRIIFLSIHLDRILEPLKMKLKKKAVLSKTHNCIYGQITNDLLFISITSNVYMIVFI